MALSMVRVFFAQRNQKLQSLTQRCYKWTTNMNERPTPRWKWNQSFRRMSFLKRDQPVGKGRRSTWRAGLLFGGASIIGYYTGEIIKSTTIFALDGSPAHVTPSRSIIHREDDSGLKVILYQYQTCPFCCKVRAFLDYNGISYDVVEVDPVMRQQIKFSKWRKVPIVLVKHKGTEEYQQLNDSSLIVSVLQSYLLDPRQTVDELINFYPSIEYKNESGKDVTEVLNRYNIMLGPTVQSQDQQIIEEQRWRMWADDVLVHTLSPNVYRTPAEALQAFKWFSQVGEWEKNFPLWERLMVIYVGATAMYFIGKRLKKRHKLDEDVRQSLYNACNEWVEALGTNQQFMGGQKPNLGDLAVFGVLNSIEGCTAFADALSNTKIGTWFYEMKSATDGGSNRLTSSSSS